MNRSIAIPTQRLNLMAKPPTRDDLLHAVREAGRENSTATVLFHAAIAERAGLGPSDHKALDVLARRGPLTAGELSDHTGLTAASVTSLIDRLEKRGLARRTRDDEDRRRIIVEPVPGGHMELAALFAPLQRAIEDLLSDYTDEQLATILDFLTRASGILREGAERLGDGGS